MKDKEKAYRDKVLGAQFIEFLRRRLILLREILADDGSIYVHLDTKKSHYLKAVLDEVFGEENFQNEIVWKRTSARSDSHTFNHIHDIVFFYSKAPVFRFNEQFLFHDPSYIDRYFTYTEPGGRRFATIDATQSGLRNGPSGMPWRGFSPADKGNHWKFAITELDRLDAEGRIYWPAKKGDWPRLKAYLDQQKGAAIQSIWTDIKTVNSQAAERIVLKLFGVREHSHKRYGFNLDGYIGTNSAVVWNYPDHRKFILDYGYVDDLHRTLRGKSGERFYVIAPVVAMAFAEDEVTLGETTYVFLKVPLSILLRLIERGVPAALKQPAREEDANEVIDAVGFDFISQPQVVWKAKKESRPGELFADYVLELSEFRAQTLATDPEDFQNFETLSMAMADMDYDGDVFQLSRVFWGEDVLKEAGGLEKAERLQLRIADRMHKCAYTVDRWPTMANGTRGRQPRTSKARRRLCRRSHRSAR